MEIKPSIKRIVLSGLLLAGLPVAFGLLYIVNGDEFLDGVITGTGIGAIIIALIPVMFWIPTATRLNLEFTITSITTTVYVTITLPLALVFNGFIYERAGEEFSVGIIWGVTYAVIFMLISIMSRWLNKKKRG